MIGTVPPKGLKGDAGSKGTLGRFGARGPVGQKVGSKKPVWTALQLMGSLFIPACHGPVTFVLLYCCRGPSQ